MSINLISLIFRIKLRGLTERNEGEEGRKRERGKRKRLREHCLLHTEALMVQRYQRSAASNKKKGLEKRREIPVFLFLRDFVTRSIHSSGDDDDSICYIPSTFFFFSPQILAVLTFDTKLRPCLFFASLTVLPNVKNLLSFLFFISF